MKRRKFLQYGALGGTALALPLGSSGKSSGPNENIAQDFDIEETTVAALQEGMQSGKYTARAITEKYLSRIEALDRQRPAGRGSSSPGTSSPGTSSPGLSSPGLSSPGLSSREPALRAVIETNPDALAIADTLDQERKEGKVRGPLHGIPVLIKDNIDTADNMQTTAGSLALVGSKVREDSFVAQKLREAGAIILGKTNLSEWANFRSERSSSGWSGRGGQTRNPYALDRNPCGSSSGSGVAVSANLCTIAIGTETNGSIVCPSSANGVVGIKPTVGLVSRAGIIPISHSQDTAGPMARTVTDAAILLGALTGVDPRDPVTSESQGKSYQDYTRFLDKQGLQGARIGVGRNFFGFHEKVDQLMEEAMLTMKEQGATLIDLGKVMPDEDLEGAGYQVLLYEFKADLNKYLAGLGPDAPVRTLQDLIAFNKAHAKEEMPYFEQEIFLKAEAKGDLDTPEYKDALQKVHEVSRTKGIDKAMQEHQLDAIIAPTGGPAWKTDLINGDHFGGGSSSPAAIAGYPNITVPAGYVFGLPVGISFFASAYQEPTLIRSAYAFEQATQHRKAPKFLAKAEL